MAFEDSLEEVFEGLRENAHKLTTWEIDRLEEWEPRWRKWKTGKGQPLTPRQLEVLEQMWQKV